MYTFNSIDDLLQIIPQDTALAVSLDILESEFNLSKIEIINVLKTRGFFLALNAGRLAIARSEKIIEACIAGAAFVEMREFKVSNNLPN